MPARAPRICPCGAVVQPGRSCSRCSPARRQAEDAQRPSARKRGYDTRWDKARAGYLAKHPLCAKCEEYGETTLATVVDHITPHNGDPKLFWDSNNNWMALCRACHNGAKQSMEKTATDTPAKARRARVMLVCGPPGAGKAAYVTRFRKAGDLVVDTDALFVALSGEPRHTQPANLMPYVAEARDAVLRRLEHSDPDLTVWLIGAGATRGMRRRLALSLAAKVIVLATPPSGCQRRILRDPGRSHLYQSIKPMIERWWQDYEPNDTDTIVEAHA